MRMCRSRYFEVGSQLSLIPEKRVYGMDDDRRLEVAFEDEVISDLSLTTYHTSPSAHFRWRCPQSHIYCEN